MDFLTLVGWIDRLYRNVGEELPLHAVQYPRRAQISYTSRRKSVITLFNITFWVTPFFPGSLVTSCFQIKTVWILCVSFAFCMLISVHLISWICLGWYWILCLSVTRLCFCPAACLYSGPPSGPDIQHSALSMLFHTHIKSYINLTLSSLCSISFHIKTLQKFRPKLWNTYHNY
jgi:hypothetical protein